MANEQEADFSQNPGKKDPNFDPFSQNGDFLTVRILGIKTEIKVRFYFIFYSGRNPLLY